MAVRLPGWDDADVLALLSLFRQHLLHYVYCSDSEFARVVRAELPDKALAEIQEMVRSLMLQFGLMLSTKNFRTDVIVANGQEVYVYEHIYESINRLPENKAGGLWLPDELSRFLQKAKMYRELFGRNEDVYFKRIQLWGKSVAETQSKFYALRDIYVRERRRSHPRTGVQAKRFALLKEIFYEVPPARQEVKIGVASKAPKLWSSEDVEKLVDFLVRITLEIQRTGSSDLVHQVAEALHRTDGSCVNKLSDMRDKFLKKSTSVRAANLPDIVFDSTSDAHKIFSADWSDSNDPYALGYLAIKSRSLRLISVRNKKRRNKSIWSPRPKLRAATMAARVASSPTSSQTASSTQNSASTSSVAASEGIQSKMSSADSKDPHENNAVSPPSSKRAASALPASDYSTFVQDVARQCQWTEKVVHNVLRCMQHSIELYHTNKLVAFFSKIASLTPGVTFQDLFAYAQHILTQFEQRFGTLDGFENLVLTAPGINSSITSAENTKEEQDGVPQNAFDTVSVTANTHRSVGLENTNQQQQPEQETVEGQRNQTPLPGSPAQTPHEDAGTNYDPDLLGSPAEMLEKGSEDTGIDNNDGQSYLIGSPAQAPQTDNEDVGASGDHDCSGSPTQTPQTRNGDAINNSDHEQSLYFGSPGQTPQTGNEDAADEHSSMTGGKQSSPEDSWDDEVDVDIDMEDDGLDNQSVGSPDNASSSPAYPLSGELASSSSKKPSKRGKDEQYGKSYDLAKKRRLHEKKSTVLKDVEGEEEEEEDEDEGYDEGDDDDDDQSDDADDESIPDDDNISSDGEIVETPHPLQALLNSVDSHIVELEEERRELIERKEDREWRQRRYSDREYGTNLSMQSFASKK